MNASLFRHAARQHKIKFATRAYSEKTEKGKFLVLGGTGFVGQQVCKQLVAQGHSVVTISRRGAAPQTEVRDLKNKKSLIIIFD